MIDHLWNEFGKDHKYSQDPALYQEHLLEQYKIYVEMADKISERRNLANVFFLSVHSTAIAIAGFSFEKLKMVEPKWLIILPISVALLLCYVWWYLIQSYRQLNTAKYEVVGQLEQRLPSSPYWSAEWHKLGEGKDKSKYRPLTHLEKIVPICFAALYVLICFYTLFG